MDIIVTKKGDQSRNAMEEAGGMEVELTAETEEAKRRQYETKIMPKNPGTSMSVGNGDMFEKTLAEIDEELGKNVIAAVGILGSLTKTEDMKSASDSFEFKGGKIDGMKAWASGDTKGLGPSPKEEVMVGSTMGFGTYAKTKIDSSNTGPLKITNGKENDGFSPKSMKGTWKWLNREATTTVAMEGGLMEEGPKRKLLPPLGETDLNWLQDKRAKIDIDEVALVDRRDYGCIRARLDRAVVTTEWSGIFPWARLYHRANSASDHCILLLKLEQNTRQKRGLMDESNQWQEDPEVVKGIAIRYYQNLFNSNQAVVQEELLEAIDAWLSEPMNALLIRDFQASEFPSIATAADENEVEQAESPDESVTYNTNGVLRRVRYLESRGF
nr:hypothetical protein CFP56_18919 [Quercus suber]